MIPTRLLTPIWLSAALLGGGAMTRGAGQDEPGMAFFESKIRPVLVEHCYECHSEEAKKIKGGLLLDSRPGWEKGGDSGPVIVPGKPNESLLLEAIRHEDEDTAMPPKTKLPAEVVAAFEKWIAEGAPDPRGSLLADRKAEPGPATAAELWSLQPVRNPPIPEVQTRAWPRGDIDRFLLAQWESQGLRPVADAAPERLLRRVFYDLTGLPPTSDDVAAFLSVPTRDAFESLVDELIASPRFGERWGRHWLDSARYADTLGNDRDRPLRYAWRYRDWVIDAVNADMPYDRFLTEQIAGDLLPADDWRQRERQQVATGFLAVGSKPLPRLLPVTPEEDKQGEYERAWNDWADDQIDAVGRGMLGLTIACARCHDHKFDPIPTRDYYALAGIFRSTELRFSLPHFLIAYEPERDYPLEPWYYFTGEPSEVEKAERLVADWWKADEARRPLLAKSKQLQNKIGKAEAALKVDESSRTAADAELIAALPDMKREFEETRAAFLAAGKIEGAKPDVRLSIGAREAETKMDAPVLARGEWNRKGEVVPRGFVSTVPVPGDFAISPETSGRLELARWIANPKNPLTARVAVNRVWHQLFGLGIVESLDNFGVMGSNPSHPELLDHLAHRFSHELGWSVKKLVREIVLSRTYQLASAHDDANFATDPGVTQFWRARPRRLEAEAIRDSLLQVAGTLDLDRPKVNPLENTLYGNNTTGDKEAAQFEAGNHRSVYVPVVRGRITEFQRLFDQPVANEVNSARNASTLPGQALFLMNGPVASRSAAALARRLLADKELTDDDARLGHAYRAVLSRNPTAEEAARDRALLADPALGGGMAAWTALCQSLLMNSEFLYRF